MPHPHLAESAPLRIRPTMRSDRLPDSRHSLRDGDLVDAGTEAGAGRDNLVVKSLRDREDPSRVDGRLQAALSRHGS